MDDYFLFVDDDDDYSHLLDEVDQKLDSPVPEPPRELFDKSLNEPFATLVNKVPTLLIYVGFSTCGYTVTLSSCTVTLYDPHLSMYDETERWHLRINGEIEGTPHLRPRSTWALKNLVNLCRTYFAKGERDNAIEMARKAQVIARETLPHDHAFHNTLKHIIEAGRVDGNFCNICLKDFSANPGLLEDGYKCDEQKPFCGRCTRLRKTCKGYGVRLKWQAPQGVPKPKTSRNKQQQRSSSGAKAVSTSSSEFSSLVVRPDPSCIVPTDANPMNRYLLNHWSTTLATMVSMVSAPQNPFLVHLTPMISHSTALRAVLCSIAACHLAILRHEDSLHTLATRHRLVAVSSLRQTIQTESPELSLATILMLQVSERLFTMDSGVDHLSGAKAIISQGSVNMRNDSSTSFLLGLCSYHDILASVSRGTSPVFEFNGRFPIEGMESMKELTSVLRIVGRISGMRGRCREDLDVQGYAVESSLNALDQSDDVMSDVEHTVQAYIHAAFIYLHRVWHNEGAPHFSAMKHARSCLTHLSLVPVDSPLVSAQVWPLWTAGCESIDQDQRQFVRVRADSMYEARHLPSLRRIKQDIEEVWKIKDEQRNLIGVDNVDCIKAILRTRQREADLA
ncbi:hypothetical protein K449DRAFT_440735 [Hypoxylon sp. EC38]|nr:hypothetical protein K449DRAFT_440735 [Hypoxylon sp. EC38]